MKHSAIALRPRKEISLQSTQISLLGRWTHLIRKYFGPAARKRYSGYVTWRGTVSEDQFLKSAISVSVETFHFMHIEGVQILEFTILGPRGTIESDERQLNWAWYVKYLKRVPNDIEFMVDRGGKRKDVTLPPGRT